MSNDPPEHRGTGEVEAVRPASPRTRGRARWYAAGLAGLTGVAGLAAFSGVAGVAGLTGANGLKDGSNGLANLSSAAAWVLAADRLDGDPNGDGAQDAGSGQQGSHGSEQLVPCSVDRLIAEIVRANASGGANLRLTARCTYTLTAAQGPDGLPVITQPITIDGQGATIMRAANAANFRILNVGTGGNLILQNLTITGGFAPGAPGGGGILIQAGGQATLRNTAVTGNQSADDGGGIANYGITTVLGQDDQGKRAGGNSSAPNNGAANAPDNAPAGSPTHTSPSGATVNNNSAQGSGAGIYNEGHLTTKNVEVSDNNGSFGGGLANQGSAVLEGTRIDHNKAGTSGGGVLSSSASITQLTDSSVSDNTAGAVGGGILCSQSTIYLQRSKVDHNTATDGGGIDNEALLIGGSPAFAVVEDSEINDNTASGDGGGIRNRFATLVLRGSHVSLNRATGTDSQGGGIFNSTGRLSLTTTQVTGNSSTNAPGGIFTSAPLVTVDQKSVIKANRPTNCTGSTFAVPNCFG